MVFKAMYDVAGDHIESQQLPQTFDGTNVPVMGRDHNGLQFSDIGAMMDLGSSLNGTSNMQSHGHGAEDGRGYLTAGGDPQINIPPVPSSQTMDSVMQLEAWIDLNQSIFNILEDIS